MAVTRVGTVTTNGGFISDVAKPTGGAAGNHYVVFVGGQDQAATPPTFGVTGFTPIGSIQGNAGSPGSYWYMQAFICPFATVPAGPFAITGLGGLWTYAFGFIVDGASGTVQVGTKVDASGSPTSINLAGVTFTGAGGLGVIMEMDYDGGAGAPTLPTNGTWSQNMGLSNAAALYNRQFAGSGATGAVTVYPYSTQRMTGLMLGFEPAGAGSSVSRSFDGTDDGISFSAGNLVGMTYGTMLAVVRITNVGYRSFVGVGTSSFGDIFGLGNATAPDWYLFSQSDYSMASGAPTVANGWVIAGMTKTAGASAPIFYKYVFSTTTWTNTTGNSMPAPTLTPLGLLCIGRTASFQNYWQGDIAGVAIWKDQVLTGTQIQTLAANWGAWHALSPTVLKILDQASVGTAVVDAIDATSTQTAITGTAIGSTSPFPPFTPPSLTPVSTSRTTTWNTLSLFGPKVAPGRDTTYGSGTSTTSNTTVTCTHGVVDIGETLVMTIVCDNVTSASLPTVSSISKAAGESASWVLVGNVNSSSATGAAGVRGFLYAITATTRWAAATQTITFSAAITAKAAESRVFYGLTAALTARGTVPTGTANGAGVSTGGAPTATTSGTAPVLGDFVLGAAFHEANTVPGLDSDTSNGAWVQFGAGQATATGATALNVGVRGQYKIVNAAGNQTLNPTCTGDSGVAVVALVPQSLADVSTSRGTTWNVAAASLTSVSTSRVTTWNVNPFQDATHPKLYYDFSGSGTTVTDMTGNGQNATMSADLRDTGQLLIDNAAEYLQYVPTSSPVTKASLTFKFKPSDVAGNCGLWVLALGSDSSGFNLFMQNNHLEFIVRDTGGNIIIWTGSSPTPPTMIDEQTYQVAVTYQSGAMKVYLDGVEIFTSSALTGPLNLASASGSGFRVGANPFMSAPNGVYHFDDIRWWDDYTLTPAEVATIAGVINDPTNLPNLYAYYVADAANFTFHTAPRVATWLDLSGNGRTMTALNGTNTGPIYPAIDAGPDGHTPLGFNTSPMTREPGGSMHTGTTMTLFAVVRNWAGASVGRVFSFGTGSGTDWADAAGFAMNTEGGMWPSGYRGGTQLSTTTSNYGTNWIIMVYVFTGTTSQLTVMNTTGVQITYAAVASTGSFNVEAFNLGASAASGGDVGNFDVQAWGWYTDAKSNADRDALIDALADDWFDIGAPTPVATSRTTTWNVAAPVTVNSFTDDFNRANGAMGSNWAALSGVVSPVIVSNAIQASSGTTDTGATMVGGWGPIQSSAASATLAADYSEVGVILHGHTSALAIVCVYTTDGTHPSFPGFGSIDGPAFQLYHLSGGTATMINEDIAPAPDGNPHRLYAIALADDLVQFWFDGKMVLNGTVPSSSVARTAKPGITVHHTTTAARADNYAAWSGDVPAAPTFTSFSSSAVMPGATVTVTGTGFITDATMLRYGESSKLALTVTSPTTATFVVPGLNHGTIPFSVETPGGESSSLLLTIGVGFGAITEAANTSPALHGSRTVAKPPGITGAADQRVFLMAFVGAASGTDPGFSPPSGFATLGSLRTDTVMLGGTGITLHTQWFQSTTDQSGATDFTVGWSSGAVYVSRVIAGVVNNTSGAETATGYVSTAGTSLAVPSLTTTVANSGVLLTTITDPGLTLVPPDYDFIEIPYSGTDVEFVHEFHATQNTAGASSTPTVSYTGGTSSALVLQTTGWKAVVGTTPVSTNRTTTWNVRAGVTTPRPTTWNVRAGVTTSRPTTWNTLFTLTAPATRPTTWRVLQSISTTRPTTWNVAAPVAGTITRPTTWRVLKTEAATRPTTWRVLQNITVARPTTWNTLATAASKIATLTDSFDTAINTGAWPDTSPAVVWDASGRAKIPCTSSYWALQTGLTAGQAYDLTTSSFFAKVTVPPVGSGSRETMMNVFSQSALPQDNKIRIYCNGTTLSAQTILAGTLATVNSTAYNATTHAWWRIRETGGTVFYDYSPDSQAWTNFASVTAPAFVNKVAAGFASGYWGTESASDTYIDNVNLALTSVATSRSTTWNVAGVLTAVSTLRSTTWHVRSLVTKTGQRVAVPSYFWVTWYNPPTGDKSWERMQAAVPTQEFAIVNPNSGPDEVAGQQTDWVHQITDAHAAGLKVYGYVRTIYTTKSAVTVKHEVDLYYSWYDVDGIFFDETSYEAGAKQAYYADLYAYVKAKTGRGRTVVINPGIPGIDETYMAAGDIVMNYEGPPGPYAGTTFPGWVSSYPASRFWHCIHDVTSEAQRDTLIGQMQAKNAGYIYLTPDSTVTGDLNPYNSLPADPFWANMLTTIGPPSRPTTWDVRTSVSTSRSTTWNTSANVTTSRPTTWSVKAPVTIARTATWDVRFAVPTATRPTTWNVLIGTPTAARTTTWRVLAPVAINRTATWNVFVPPGVVITSRTTTWNVNATLTAPATRTATWNVLRPVVGTVTRPTTWAVLTSVPTVVSRPTTWQVRLLVTTVRPTTWNVAGSLFFVSTNRSTTWVVRSFVSTTRPTTWTTLAGFTLLRVTTWRVLRTTTTLRSTTWNVSAPIYHVVVSRSTTWRVAPTAPSHDYLVLYPNTVMYKGTHRIKALYQGSTEIWRSPV